MRHPSVEAIIKYFSYDHLSGKPKEISSKCKDLVTEMLNELPEDSPELTVGLRKLLEAKDCFVRASLDM